MIGVPVVILPMYPPSIRDVHQVGNRERRACTDSAHASTAATISDVHQVGNQDIVYMCRLIYF